MESQVLQRSGLTSWASLKPCCPSQARRSTSALPRLAAAHLSHALQSSSLSCQLSGQAQSLQPVLAHRFYADKHCVQRLQAATEVGHAEPESLPTDNVADLEKILAEKGECGVGFITSLKKARNHDILSKGLTALGCMEHRGACSADQQSGDGAGIMTQIPWELFKQDIPDLDESCTGVGMVFLPNDDALEAQSKEIIKEVVAREGHCELLGFRDVPVNDEVVGRLAKITQPRICQVFLKHKDGLGGADLEREMFILRKLIEKDRNSQMGEQGLEFYICSLSCQTIVYKGMLQSSALRDFYQDLTNEAYQTGLVVYHRRFSTNTSPRWPLAQPMRVLGHNGEINTLQGNLNWVASREHALKHPVWEGREAEFLPLCNVAESDSANLDHMAEFMMRGGVDPQEALMVLVPEAYRNHPELASSYPQVMDFYEYYEGLQEGWDGPALLVFSDGTKTGARLDRNGLRPARYWTTTDGMVYVASEVGVLGDVLSNAPNVTSKGRLGPGQMICADYEEGTFKENLDIAKQVADHAPFGEWLKNSHRLSEFSDSKWLGEPLMAAADVLKLQAANGFGQEDSQMIVEGMAEQGNEPTYCMGDDIPLPVLSDRPHILYNYFKQRFAQVTNPPIDPLREGLVMSLAMRLGHRGNLLQPGPDAYSQILLESPILKESELEAIRSGEHSLKSQTFSLYYQSGKTGAMKEALEKLTSDIEQAVRDGCEVVILSDRLPEGEAIDIERPPIQTLLAVGATHHHLIKKGLRTSTSIVAETAQCFSTHHCCVLVGYGAHAVCPYLAFETCRQWRLSSRVQGMVKSGKVADVSVEDAQQNYKKALEKGMLKILSKMGISLLSCYHGAQIFEIYGLGKEVVDTAFRGSVSRIGGLSLDEIQRESESFWIKGFPEKAMKKLEDYGFIQARPRGEYHANNQQMAKLLHKAVGLGGKEAAPQEAYDAYKQHFEASPAAVLRDCIDIVPAGEPISIDEVESAANIMERFCTGGMSLGAISRETHETIAVAMNRIGGKSNSGEGGEDPVRWEVLDDVDAEGNSPTFPYLKGLKEGDTASSRIKQVASGRFGVTPQFLANASQLEIKIAQGAKPGEGGQLPGKKVSPYIANLRRSKPGVPLISPPPHHDIYSIEDLAQLIFDLHQAAPASKVSVKLVAQAGIGTVASGVAKANADIIQVSGHDGGTGASPVSSIKHAGGPIEMGLADVHQSLVSNELRERVILRVDGGMRNGRDVLVSAALGGDEYGFGTVAMIATGCIMARVCHTNNCPVGVASQREELRARFPGAPGDLVNYFQFVAEEVRAGLAALGLRSLDELVGRADLLKQRDIRLAKTTGLDLSFVTTFAGPTGSSSKRMNNEVHSNGPQLDDEILADPEVMAAIKENGNVERRYDINNVQRTLLGRVGGCVAKHHGDFGFSGSLTFNLFGSAGQSFGSWLVTGIHVKLTGEANDYVGKGMAGGEIVIVNPPDISYRPEDSSLVGNTCLYGATGGRLFVNGRAGERFAVRNSMASAVVEGTGDHCCEYMTGGCVVSLGTVGRNVAAGMTGGLGYFYDADGLFPEKVNTEIVDVRRVQTQAGQNQLRELITTHVEHTGSSSGKAILDDWNNEVQKFWQLVPPSEGNTPEANLQIENRRLEHANGFQSSDEPVAAAA